MTLRKKLNAVGVAVNCDHNITNDACVPPEPKMQEHVAHDYGCVRIKVFKI